MERYWCHQCLREFPVTGGSGVPPCIYCHGDFVEAITGQETALPWQIPSADGAENAGENQSIEEDAEYEEREGEDSEGDNIGAADPFGSGPMPFMNLQQLLMNVLHGPAIAGQRVATTADRRETTTTGRGSAETGSTSATFVSFGPHGEHRQQFHFRAGGSSSQSEDTPTQQLDLNRLLQQMFMQVTENGGRLGATGFGGTGIGGNAAFPFAELFGMSGNPGDYVMSSRGLDDVISRLMEQTSSHNAPPPAPETVLEQLPRRKPTAQELQSEECAVCKDRFEAESTLMILPCKHVFHEGCVLEWLRINGTCPVCRFPISNACTRDDTEQELEEVTSPQLQSHSPPPHQQ